MSTKQGASPCEASTDYKDKMLFPVAGQLFPINSLQE